MAEFLWGAASAAYQVEGAWRADGKGLSNWDVRTNDDRITEQFIGQQQTGNIACNTYDRAQYLADIGLMRQLGLNAYRFSISWSRLIPDGTGEVNKTAVDYYRRFVDDLLQNGIEPLVTLFHWDLPWALVERGGWRNRESVDWFRHYARVVFDALGDRVKTFITFNEPYWDLFWMTPIAENVRAGKPDVWPTAAQYGQQAVALHHWMLAHTLTIRDYRAAGRGGQIGIALSLIPTIPQNADNPDDVAAARIADGLFNRWCLDPLIRGNYPDDVLAAVRQHNPDLVIPDEDLAALRAQRTDFFGVNYYAPCYIRHDENGVLGFRWMDTNPDEIKAFNGPVRPEYLYRLLLRMRDEYGNPPMMITENGAGFGARDEVLEGGTVKDPLRADYVRRHIEAVLDAQRDGADLRGYILWCLLDNFEWLHGFERRFGMVRVDFDTQERTPKQSFHLYQEIIAKHRGKEV